MRGDRPELRKERLFEDVVLDQKRKRMYIIDKTWKQKQKFDIKKNRNIKEYDDKALPHQLPHHVGSQKLEGLPSITLTFL